jgi:DNA transformation protein
MNEFVNYLHEVFERLGPITVRRMFNGHMLYHQGLPIGIVYDETLFLKADIETAHEFDAMGLARFSYQKAGKKILLPYYQAPEAVLEDRDEALRWGRRAYEAALRMDKTRPKKRPKKSE